MRRERESSASAGELRPRVPDGVARRFVSVDYPGWVQAHASTVVEVAGGLVAAWFAGTREGTPDNRIWLSSRSHDGAWSPPRVVVEGAEAHWNPVLAHGPDGRLWLFAKCGSRISRWRTWVLRSDDDGATWSEPELLVADDTDGRGPVKNPPLALPDGTWLAPGSTERWGDAPLWEAFVDRSLDGGRTWEAVPIPLDRAGLTGAGVIQPALWRAGDMVHALLRSTEGRAYRSSSADCGRTWTRAQPTGLANNNSGLTAVALTDDAVACVHNPVSGDWAARCPLVVSVSLDAGETWRQVVTLEDGVTPVGGDPFLVPTLPPAGEGFVPADGGVGTTGIGEYSYPAAAVVGDELVVTYTWQRRGVVEARVPLRLLA